MSTCDNNNQQTTQSIADYLAQLLKDRKQLAAFPTVFNHVERLLDEGSYDLTHFFSFFFVIFPISQNSPHALRTPRLFFIQFSVLTLLLRGLSYPFDGYSLECCRWYRLLCRHRQVYELTLGWMQYYWIFNQILSAIDHFVQLNEATRSQLTWFLCYFGLCFGRMKPSQMANGIFSPQCPFLVRFAMQTRRQNEIASYLGLICSAMAFALFSHNSSQWFCNRIHVLLHFHWMTHEHILRFAKFVVMQMMNVECLFILFIISRRRHIRNGWLTFDLVFAWAPHKRNRHVSCWQCDGYYRSSANVCAHSRIILAYPFVSAITIQMYLVQPFRSEVRHRNLILGLNTVINLCWWSVMCELSWNRCKPYFPLVLFFLPIDFVIWCTHSWFSFPRHWASSKKPLDESVVVQILVRQSPSADEGIPWKCPHFAFVKGILVFSATQTFCQRTGIDEASLAGLPKKNRFGEWGISLSNHEANICFISGKSTLTYTHKHTRTIMSWGWQGDQGCFTYFISSRETETFKIYWKFNRSVVGMRVCYAMTLISLLSAHRIMSFDARATI